MGGGSLLLRGQIQLHQRLHFEVEPALVRLTMGTGGGGRGRVPSELFVQIAIDRFGNGDG